MNTIRLALLLALASCSRLCPAAEPQGSISVVIRHEYYWQEFTLTKEQPFSDNRHFRLKTVRKSGEVELIDCATAEIETKVVTVKPRPKKTKEGERPPTIIVVAADFEKQTATITEWRMK